ncbi:MAG: hypothetical protein IKO27_05700 [Ruminococcus sp.]|nr:hypothetical protein [Ruminococcus sp.]
MIRLIKTNLQYLTFRELFLVGAAGALFLGIRGGLLSYDNSFSGDYLIFAVLICAAVTLLNVGREHMDGVIRNKLTLGFTRMKIYASFIITSAVSSTVLYLLTAVPFFAVSSANVAKYMPEGEYFKMALICYVTALVITMGSTVLAICVPRLSIAAVLLLASAIGFVVMSHSFEAKLSQSRTNSYMISYRSLEDIKEYGENMDDFYYDPLEDAYIGTQEQENEYYVGGTSRSIMRTVLFCDPYFQLQGVTAAVRLYEQESFAQRAEMILNTDFDPDVFDFRYDVFRNYHTFPIYSGVFIVILITAGALVFRKININ